MTQTRFKTLPLPYQFLNSHPALYSLFLIPLCLTACSTANPRRDLLMHVFNDQNDVLQKIKTERQAAAVATKVKKDPALSEAEAHLDQAISSITDANNAIKGAL